MMVLVNIEKYANDGRLTEPSDGKRYNWRKIISRVEKLGRPLTQREVEDYRLK